MCMQNGQLTESCESKNKLTKHDVANYLMTKPSSFNTLKSQRLSTPLLYTMRFETDRLKYALTSEDQLFAQAIDTVLLKWATNK